MKHSRKLFTGISQEIRTHMNAIVGFSFLLEKKNSCKGDDWSYSNQILNSCNKLIWLFESFFEVSTDDNPDFAANMNKCRLTDFLDSIISEFRGLMYQINNTDIVLLTENHYSNLQEVYFDSTKVKKVISCLVHNAINNAKTGYLKVGYHLDSGKVTFYVLDTGQDYLICRELLETEDIKTLHAKCFDVSSAINIMLAKKIVQAMGGTIWFDLNNITGTAAYFSVPVKPVGSVIIPTRDCLETRAIQPNY